MTEENFYKKYKPYQVVLTAAIIAVTTGFGIQYLLIITEHSVLYSQTAALLLASMLSINYALSETQNIRLKREKQGDSEDGK